MTRSDTPRFVVPDAHLIPQHTYLAEMVQIPPSRMSLIRAAMHDFTAAHGPDTPVYDASQGDGGMYLPGVTPELHDRANVIMKQHGTAYDYPYGCDAFREAVSEQYWRLDPALGWGPQNVIAACGGRDALVRAYTAMIHLSTARTGDVLLTTRVPWLSYNWGPYSVGANVLLAPGDPDAAWQHTEDGITASIRFAARTDRHIFGIVITSPDNPTGYTLPLDRQIALGKHALAQGIDFVIYDWIYHYVTAGDPVDANAVLDAFTPQERERLIILDGITKALGASNVRGAHLLAGRDLIAFMAGRAAYSVVPHIHGQAVALAAYAMGYREAAAPVVAPTNASRVIVRDFLTRHGYRFILGDGGYYAFIDVQTSQTAGGF
ncbi:MAG: pyridoxal phosphate-dependent aminotransferase, partial [Anaerolineae bacterium]|nr:pyridoxal phosphate-dependent aminotransferase [Anaerolineae bacterium]